MTPDIKKWFTKSWWFDYQTRIKVVKTTTTDLVTGEEKVTTRYHPQYRRIIWSSKWNNICWALTEGKVFYVSGVIGDQSDTYSLDRAKEVIDLFLKKMYKKEDEKEITYIKYP